MPARKSQLGREGRAADEAARHLGPQVRESSKENRGVDFHRGPPAQRFCVLRVADDGIFAVEGSELCDIVGRGSDGDFVLRTRTHRNRRVAVSELFIELTVPEPGLRVRLSLSDDLVIELALNLAVQT